jgi:hypothetical protein
MKPAVAVFAAGLFGIASGAPVFASSISVARTSSTKLDGLVLQTKAIPGQAVVQVKPLHDAGGLAAVSADGDTINVSYTEAIRRYLTTGGYTVVDKPPKGSSPAYSVEGDLSHLTVDAAGNGPYLCVLRLFAENGKHTLIGQWAGVAQSLRYLTANLNETEGVDSEGLLGELGGKIAEAIRASSDTTGAATFAAIVDVASQPDLIDAFPVVIPDPTAASTAHIGQPETPPQGQIHAGDKFRLQIRSTEPGNLVIVGLGPNGEPRDVLIPDDAHAVTVQADKPVVIPADTPILADNAQAPFDLKFVVLEHRAASANPVEATVDDELPVRVLRGTSPPSSPTPHDASVSLLLRRILADPPHTWIAHPVTLHVVPKE